MSGNYRRPVTVRMPTVTSDAVFAVAALAGVYLVMSYISKGREGVLKTSETYTQTAEKVGTAAGNVADAVGGIGGLVSDIAGLGRDTVGSVRSAQTEAYKVGSAVSSAYVRSAEKMPDALSSGVRSGVGAGVALSVAKLSPAGAVAGYAVSQMSDPAKNTIAGVVNTAVKVSAPFPVAVSKAVNNVISAVRKKRNFKYFKCLLGIADGQEVNLFSLGCAGRSIRRFRDGRPAFLRFVLFLILTF